MSLQFATEVSRQIGVTLGAKELGKTDYNFPSIIIMHTLLRDSNTRQKVQRNNFFYV